MRKKCAIKIGNAANEKHLKRDRKCKNWQAPDAPPKRITAKCTIKTYFFDLLSWGGPAFDLFNEVKRVRFDGAFCSDTF